jgi:hypothetical protein
MRKSTCGALLTSALAALGFAAMCLRESSSQPNRGFAKFTACPAPPESGESSSQTKEMIEIRREDELKFLPPDGPNKPITVLGNNCYVGLSEGRSETVAIASAPRHELRTAAEVETNSKTNSAHEQNQLEKLLE